MTCYFCNLNKDINRAYKQNNIEIDYEVLL